MAEEKETLARQVREERQLRGEEQKRHKEVKERIDFVEKSNSELQEANFVLD